MIAIKKKYLFTALSILLIGICAGAFVGVVTNMINGLISPFYYQYVLGWTDQNIWLLAVRQGLFEGAIYGGIFSLLFSILFLILTRNQPNRKFLTAQIIKITRLTFLFWIIGGVLGIIFATFNVGLFFMRIPYAYGLDKLELTKFAWVRGSIDGGIFGGILSVIITSVTMKNSWTKMLKLEKSISEIKAN